MKETRKPVREPPGTAVAKPAAKRVAKSVAKPVVKPVAKPATAKGKAIARKKAVAILPRATPSLADDIREERIRLAAYLRAERRGFAPGYELEDWLAAEAELAAVTGSPGDE